MSYAQAVQLLEDLDSVTVGDYKNYTGGNTALVVQASSYPTTLQLQLKGRDGNPINIGSNLTADGLTVLELPMGEYRMNVVGGTATDVYVTLSVIPS